MNRIALSGIVVLTIGFLSVTGLFVRSTVKAAKLEQQITTLEQDRERLRSEATDLQEQISHSRAETSQLRSRLRPFETKQAAVTRISQELVVAPGATAVYQFTPAIAPGTLSGSWRASGRGFDGFDDTISAFRLTNPQDAILDKSTPDTRPSSGTFIVKLTSSGTYTLFFDNKGLLRNTPRRVFLEAEFRPD
jgi:hypothetical protein